MRQNYITRPTIPGWPEKLSEVAYFLKTVSSPVADVSMFETEEYEFFSFCVSFMQKYNGASQNFQDAWALYRHSRLPGGLRYFVEFGAYDGIYASNSLVLQKQLGWNGILCEPNPNWKSQLLKLRHNPPHVHVETDHCITEKTGDKVSFLITEKSDFSTIQGYQYTDYNSQHRENNTMSVTLPTLSLNDLLQKYKAPEYIDFMSVDTEGSELDILHAFDFEKYYVRQICIEHNFHPIRERIYQFMTSKGYRREFTEFSRWDDFYIKKDAIV